MSFPSMFVKAIDVTLNREVLLNLGYITKMEVEKGKITMFSPDGTTYRFKENADLKSVLEKLAEAGALIAFVD